MRTFLPLLAVCLLAGCGGKGSPDADSLDAFVASGFDSVTVYSLEATRDVPGAKMSMSSEEYSKLAATVDSTRFHGFPILKTVVVNDQAKGSKIAASMAKGMRSRSVQHKCFDPQHGLRISRGESHFDLVICYSCGFVEVWSASRAGVMATTSSASEGTLSDALKAAKP